MRRIEDEIDLEKKPETIQVILDGSFGTSPARRVKLFSNPNFRVKLFHQKKGGTFIRAPNWSAGRP